MRPWQHRLQLVHRSGRADIVQTVESRMSTKSSHETTFVPCRSTFRRLRLRQDDCKRIQQVLFAHLVVVGDSQLLGLTFQGLHQQLGTFLLLPFTTSTSSTTTTTTTAAPTTATAELCHSSEINCADKIHHFLGRSVVVNRHAEEFSMGFNGSVQRSLLTW